MLKQRFIHSTQFTAYIYGFEEKKDTTFQILHTAYFPYYNPVHTPPAYKDYLEGLTVNPQISMSVCVTFQCFTISSRCVQALLCMQA